jgi:hypothetical protein
MVLISFLNLIENGFDVAVLITGICASVWAFIKFNKSHNLKEMKILNDSLTSQNTTLMSRVNDLDNKVILLNAKLDDCMNERRSLSNEVNKMRVDLNSLINKDLKAVKK